MQRSVRRAGYAVAGTLGVGAAAVAASGDSGLRACASKRTGEIHATSAAGKCRAGSIVITISGDAFKSSKSGTLTINGVAFKGRRGGTLTINGTAFNGSARGQTTTINGTPFKSSKSGTLTINGVAFQGGGRGQTLTINGTPFSADGAAQRGATGPIGPAGRDGRDGSPGAAALTPSALATPPGVVPAAVNGGATTLAELDFSNTDGKAHRLLLTGGFDVVCNPCAAEPPKLEVGAAVKGGGALFGRRVVSGSETAASISEIVVAPEVCAPCTLALRLSATDGSGATAGSVDASRIRFGLVDLGPAP